MCFYNLGTFKNVLNNFNSFNIVCRLCAPAFFFVCGPQAFACVKIVLRSRFFTDDQTVLRE